MGSVRVAVVLIEIITEENHGKIRINTRPARSAETSAQTGVDVRPIAPDILSADPHRTTNAVKTATATDVLNQLKTSMRETRNTKTRGDATKTGMGHHAVNNDRGREKQQDLRVATPMRRLAEEAIAIRRQEMMMNPEIAPVASLAGESAANHDVDEEVDLPAAHSTTVVARARNRVTEVSVDASAKSERKAPDDG
jgi:hypothetical protein